MSAPSVVGVAGGGERQDWLVGAGEKREAMAVYCPGYIIQPFLSPELNQQAPVFDFVYHLYDVDKYESQKKSGALFGHGSSYRNRESKGGANKLLSAMKPSRSRLLIHKFAIDIQPRA